MRKTICLIAGSFNEGQVLDRFLGQHLWADEIIVLDSGSTDNSKEVCDKYNRRFLHCPAKGNFNQRYAWGLKQAKSDWVFYIYPDEYITPELKDEIFKALENDNEACQAYEFVRVNFFMDKPLRYGGASHYSLKIFKRDCVSFQGDSYHDRPIVKGRIGRLKGNLYHYPNPNIHWMLQKFNYYSEFDMVTYYQRYGILSPRKFKWLLLTKPFKNFWKCYIKKKGYKDGLNGFIYAAVIWAFDVIRICKYGERYIQKNPYVLAENMMPNPWECRKR